MVPERSKRIIRIVIVDDHPIVRDGLKSLLARDDDIQVVGEAGDGNEALARVQELNPDVLLLDLRMPTLDGLSVLRVLQESNHNAKIIIFTAVDDPNELARAVELGCSGIVLKHAPADIIAKSIHRVHGGELCLDSYSTAAIVKARQCSSPLDVAGAGNERITRSSLTEREREIVSLVAQGFNNKEVAQRMIIGQQTVKNHLHHVFVKLGVSNRLELALYGIRNGYLLHEEV